MTWCGWPQPRKVAVTRAPCRIRAERFGQTARGPIPGAPNLDRSYDEWAAWLVIDLVFCRAGDWWFWLRGGQWDGSADERKGAALVWGGFGESGHGGVSAVVANVVAGQRGEVVEQAAEAA
jgi:hypothetical protein